MKSVVLCEIVHGSEDFKSLKDGKVDEKEKNAKENATEKQIVNGISNCKKPKIAINCSKSVEKCSQESRESVEILDEEVSEIVEEQCEPPKENGAGEDSGSSGTDRSSGIARPNLSSDGVNDCSVSSLEDKVAESDAQSSSEIVQDLLSVRRKNFCIRKVVVSKKTENEKDGCRTVREEGQWENLIENSNDSPLEESLYADAAEEKEGSEDSVVHIDVDVDENKENEKERKTDLVEEFSEGEALKKQPSGCEIQVGDVQSMTGLEKDSMWADNDFKSSGQSLKEVTGEERGSSSQDVPFPTEGTTEGTTEDEEEIPDLEMDESAMFENLEESMHIEEEKEEEGYERGQEAVCEDSGDLSSGKLAKDGTSESRSVQEKKESAVCRKRQPSDIGFANSSVKKKRLLRHSKEAVQVETEDENMEDSSLSESPAGADIVTTKGDPASPDAETVASKRTSSKDKSGKKLKSSEDVKEVLESTSKFSVLERLRGSLKTLTRSDLEELIVQKLCEVITERSNVGELRRKAQALEQDQERWKIKVQALTKQMREMEMVMKKYMAEVQKQVKDGDTHSVTPLKVTRSVGLQVSFYSSANKGPKQSVSQPPTASSPVQNSNSRNLKVTPPKAPPQQSPANQNLRNKSSPYQKGSPTAQKTVSQQKRSIVPQPDYSSPQSNRTVSKSLLNNGRGVQNNTPRTNYKSVPNSPATTTTALTSPAQQQQQQSGSKVIDLTDDDDRQTGNIVRTPGPIRVVNHLTQAPASQGNRFAYLLPTTSASAVTSGGQSRQVLIAAPTMPQPTRQIMCSMPPLFFKGGNVVQSGSQSHVINQSNKVILPKVLRHPAPLPQQPLNQNTRPNLKLLPPRPALKISKVQTGIVLSWNMSLSPEHAPIASYQLYAYQESNCPPATSLWKKVGDVKALPLPMACTLTQFMSGHKYHFAVRAVDLHSRIGPFSFPGTIVLVK